MQIGKLFFDKVPGGIRIRVHSSGREDSSIEFEQVISSKDWSLLDQGFNPAQQGKVPEIIENPAGSQVGSQELTQEQKDILAQFGSK